MGQFEISPGFPGVRLQTGFAVPTMPSMAAKRGGTKRPNDFNMMAKAILDEATGPDDADPTVARASPEAALRVNAAELGRRGGLKGGKARAAALTPKQRAEAAQLAASARWKKSR